MASYAHLVDSGRFDDVVDLFTADGVLEVKGREPAVGHDGLRAFFRGVGDDLAETTTVPLIRHYTSNLSIDVVGPYEANARCYFLALTETGVDHWGRYRDRLVPSDDGRWRFASASSAPTVSSRRPAQPVFEPTAGVARHERRTVRWLLVVLERRAAAHDVAVAVDAVDAAHGRPVLVVPQRARPGTRRRRASTGATSRRSRRRRRCAARCAAGCRRPATRRRRPGRSRSRIAIIASTNRSSSPRSSDSVGSIISVPATGNDIVGAWKP